MEPKLLKEKWTKLSHEILEDVRIPEKYRLEISALYGIIYNGSKQYGYCSFTQEYLGSKIFRDRQYVGRLLKAMDELCYIHIESIKLNNTGSVKTQTKITVLDKKIMKKTKAVTSLPTTNNVAADDEQRPSQRRINRIIKKNNKETIENSFLNSIEENTKEEKFFPNSIRNIVNEIVPNINNEGQILSTVFGKGFNKWSEDLYDV